MVVGESIHLSQLDQGSVHDRKLGPMVIVSSPEAEAEVLETHIYQSPYIVRAYKRPPQVVRPRWSPALLGLF